MIKDEPENDHKVVIKLDDSDEKEGVLDGEDVDSEMDVPAVTAHKGELMRDFLIFLLAVFGYFMPHSRTWF
jgi:hypothetical protein